MQDQWVLAIVKPDGVWLVTYAVLIRVLMELDLSPMQCWSGSWWSLNCPLCSADQGPDGAWIVTYAVLIRVLMEPELSPMQCWSGSWWSLNCPLCSADQGPDGAWIVPYAVLIRVLLLKVQTKSFSGTAYIVVWAIFNLKPIIFCWLFSACH